MLFQGCDFVQQVCQGLHPSILITLRRSIIYFCWEIKLPFFEWANSIPKKYVNLPKSFVSNSLGNYF